MNLLTSADFSQLFFIDVDSYQTQTYRAGAIMESIRDRHAPPNSFSVETDWFSFAVVSFQMFVGIHPYKGKHPSLKGLDARMLNQVSVLNPAVRVPKVAYDVRLIPDPMLAWYEAVFERGVRTAPPAVGNSVVAVPVRTVSGSGLVDMTPNASLDGPISGVWTHAGQRIVATRSGVWLGDRKVNARDDLCGVAVHPNSQKVVALYRGASGYEVRELLSGDELVDAKHVKRATSYGGRIYMFVGETIVEVHLVEAGSTIVASTRVCATVLPHATALFVGFALQNLLGSAYLSVFPEAGKSHQIRIPELDEYQVVDGRFEAGVLMCIARPRGAEKHRSDRIVMRFHKDYTSYDVRIETDVASTGVEFAVLDTGVCVALVDDDCLEVSHAQIGKMGTRRIDDQAIGGGMVCAQAGRLLYAQDTTLYGLRLRSKSH